VPAELRRRETRLARVREREGVLEARAKADAQAEQKPVEAAKPEGKAQYSFTEPESRIMKGPLLRGGLQRTAEAGIDAYIARERLGDRDPNRPSLRGPLGGVIWSEHYKRHNSDYSCHPNS
jgi:hypothetical protein